MSPSSAEKTTANSAASLSDSVIDFILTAQIAVAWAGERGEDKRLGWWRTDLKSEFGGEDLFQRLLPHTWRWAVLQAVREAARLTDAKIRSKDHNPDRITSLYNLGFDLDERLDERLGDFKRSGIEPEAALPTLKEIVGEHWDAGAFGQWITSFGQANYVTAPVGRRLKGDAPEGAQALVSQLLAALAPLSDEYPLPHYKRSA